MALDLGRSYVAGIFRKRGEILVRTRYCFGLSVIQSSDLWASFAIQLTFAIGKEKILDKSLIGELGRVP